jgi:hypothetical protein
MAFDIQTPQDIRGIDTDLDLELTETPEVPSTLSAILNPIEALEAAQRMQRWYRTTSQGIAHSIFGRDGRRVEGRLAFETMAHDD